MNFSDQLIQWLAEKGYDPVYGARPLKRLIQTSLLNKVAKEIISGVIKPDAKCDLDIQNNEVVISVK
jgi:ATP-dependent Clp protease ATP-binding subunit ClpB